MFRLSYQKKLKEIASKHNISYATAEEIIRSQWAFSKSIMYTSLIYEGYCPTIPVQHLGKFLITERRKWVCKNKASKKKEE